LLALGLRDDGDASENRSRGIVVHGQQKETAIRGLAN